MLWLYNLGIQFYHLIVSIFSLFNTKAKLFLQGRTNIFEIIHKQLDSGKTHIWFHFASLGEFEQGRPVLEKIKYQYPQKRIVVTFFSPSGYEIRKNYNLAAGVFYLPLDTATNARKFISAVNPELAVFTKYEYWYHYFKTLHDQHIPLIIISGIFRPDQIFFKWYGAFNRNILSFVSHFFVQNIDSVRLLSQININQVSLSGDTRFDRVAENAKTARHIEKVRQFCGQDPVIIAGSTWPADEALLAILLQSYPQWKLIIAPHEIDNSHVESILKLFPKAVKYSELKSDDKSSVLIMDNIGLLSSLYQYGNIAYIGGGFGAGIHNTLEAAAFSIPVIFGPKYQKFQEAKDLIELDAACSINNQQELLEAFKQLTNNPTAGTSAGNYVNDRKGATDQTVDYLEKYF